MRNFLRILAYLALGYLLLSVESPLLVRFHLRMYAPDPTLAIVVFSALVLDFLPGMATAALLGLMKDGFSAGVPVGLHVEIYLLIFLACVILSNRFDYRNTVLMTAVTAGASLLASFLFFVFVAIFDRDFEQFDLIFRLAIPQALITAPMGPIVAALLKWVDKKLTDERDGTFR